jgi:glutamate synthase domain-containing protein 3
MKEYGDEKPTIIIGGSTGDYLGEYMAGGNILVLGRGMGEDRSPVGSFIGTGIHGG